MNPSASLVLIIATVAITLASFTRPSWLRAGMLHPYGVVQEAKWHQLVTSGFLHADLGHLFMNMFTLFFFGPSVEKLLGPWGFLLVYFGSMVLGSLLAVLRHGGDPNYRALGASGAVSGILFSFVLFRPFAPIYLFLIPIGIPAVLFAFGYVAVSLYGMRARLGNIGHDAHLGGAIGGALITLAIHPDVLRIFLGHFR